MSRSNSSLPLGLPWIWPLAPVRPSWLVKLRVLPLGTDSFLEEEMATHTSILAWKIPRTASAIYWSNIPEVIAQLGDRSGNTLDWSTDPLTIQLGTTEIIEGLERTLPGCHEADSVQVYMTSNLAYGKHLVGVVPKNSMVAWYMKIEKVTK